MASLDIKQLCELQLGELPCSPKGAEMVAKLEHKMKTDWTKLSCQGPDMPALAAAAPKELRRVLQPAALGARNAARSQARTSAEGR